jgi:hypothetical protein
MRARARPRFELRNTASFPYALPSVEGEGLETTRPESVMASRKFGDWTPEGWYKGCGEKCILQTLPRAIEAAPQGSLERKPPQNPRNFGYLRDGEVR